jgi:ABC-type transport system substrate-binding protein
VQACYEKTFNQKIMTIKSKLTVLSLLVAVLATSFAAVSAYADEGELMDKTQIQQKLQEGREAIENGDYDAVSEMYQNRTGEELSENQFKVMQEAHTMMQEGNREGAKAILDEAGVQPPKMQQLKKMNGEFQNNLTEEQKGVLEQSRELKQEGDLEGAKALLEDSGIPLPAKKGNFNKNCKFGQ